MRTALVHDSLTQYGGAEKVLEELHAVFPEAPVFVPNIRREVLPAAYDDWDIRTTWLDRVPGSRTHHRSMAPLYPFAMHGIDLSGYDLVISSSFNFAHNVSTGPQTRHVCYCHSPSRFLWDYNGYAEREKFGRVKRACVEASLPLLRSLDMAAAQGVDGFIATSGLVRDRIRKIYRRRARVLPPPIDLSAFHIARQPERYFLLIMRLVGWKRADIAVEACNALNLPLVVAGDGRELGRLQALAGPSVRFAGRVDGAEKARLLSECAALILPAMEDFGITPLEAMASGRPVIAYGAGGVLDTVQPGRTGVLFPEQTTESLIAALRRFDPDEYDPNAIRAHAARFDRRHFRAAIGALAHVEAAGLADAPPRREERPVAPPSLKPVGVVAPCAATLDQFEH